MDLQGKTAVITGGASGIGAAIVEAFSSHGANVVVGDTAPSAETVESLASQGKTVIYQVMDVRDEDGVAKLMDTAVDRFGALDILVANAGIPEQKTPIHELDFEAWQEIIDINLTGLALCNKHAAKKMLDNGSGSIINMGSVLGHVGQKNSTAYSASKAAVINLTRSIALTYAQDNIRVNCISPGYVDTPLIKKLPQHIQDDITNRMPTGRLLDPEEVANVAVFLASEKASGITAAAINVDGGYTAL